MDNTNQFIAGLWEEAKQEAPQRSLAEAQAAFTWAIAGGATGGAGDSGSGLSSIININSIIMSSVVLVVASLVWSFWPGADEIQKAELAIGDPIVEMVEPRVSNQRTIVLTQPIVRDEEGSLQAKKEEAISSLDPTVRAKQGEQI